MCVCVGVGFSSCVSIQFTVTAERISTKINQIRNEHLQAKNCFSIIFISKKNWCEEMDMIVFVVFCFINEMISILRVSRLVDFADVDVAVGSVCSCKFCFMICNFIISRQPFEREARIV